MTDQIYSDGACRGNPGPSGIGAVILNDKGKTLHEISKYIGNTTNNVAEYEALLEALDYCVKKKLSPVEILADSQLMIRQLSGQYKVKHPNMIPPCTKGQKGSPGPAGGGRLHACAPGMSIKGRMNLANRGNRRATFSRNKLRPRTVVHSLDFAPLSFSLMIPLRGRSVIAIGGVSPSG